MNEKSKQKIKAMYITINAMLAHLGAYGEIGPRHRLVSDVMDALHDIDGGTFDTLMIDNIFNDILR